MHALSTTLTNWPRFEASQAGLHVVSLSLQPRPCLSGVRETAHADHRRTITRPSASLSTALVLAPDEQQHYREVDEGDLDLNRAAPSDFYQLLSIDYDADTASIRSSYRALQRVAHPDIAGDCATELAVLLNSAYATLSDKRAKEGYDAGLRRFRSEHAIYDGMPVSEWFGPPGEQRAAFVDETQCIGCRQCTSISPSTFVIEEDYGRARVMAQWADDAEYITEAIDLCPVDCIHYVPRDQLALLEFVMKSCKRENAAILARRRSGNMAQAPGSQSPFEQAATFLRHRRDAKVKLQPTGMQLAQDEALAASISRAWIALPLDLRRAGWPSWCEHTERVV